MDEVRGILHRSALRDSGLGEAGGNGLESARGLGAREGGAEAVVDSLAEREVLAGVRAIGVETVRIVEHGLVAVGGAEEKEDLRAARQRGAPDGGVLER